MRDPRALRLHRIRHCMDRDAGRALAAGRSGTGCRQSSEYLGFCFEETAVLVTLSFWDFLKKESAGLTAAVSYKCLGLFQHFFGRSEEHTSELQSHSFISYAVFCLKKKK